jgi:hypothetical protein
MRRVGGIVALCACMLAGCATKGDRIDVAIPGASSGPSTMSPTSTGPRVVVKPFEDARLDRTHLGSRSHFWGGTSYFELSKRGWQARMDGSGGQAPDATITGTIQDLSVDAVSKFGHTEMAAKNTMMVRVANHGDESSIQERLLGSGSDEVFWFEPEDAQQLVNEVLEKNIEKFMADTKVDGRAVRLK